MVSRVFMICTSYESGYGHGLADDGLDLSKTPHGDPECGEAYQLGYEAGQEGLKIRRKAVEFAGELVDALLTPNASLSGASRKG